MKNLSKAGVSMFVYGVYVLFLGLGTLTLQQYIMPLMGMSAGADHWVYIVGVFAVALSYYYMFSAKAEDKTFFRLSVHGRVWFFCATCVLVALGIAPKMMLAMAVVDLAGAIWTWKSLGK